jgi:predicted amidohydrolase YtcJ
MFVSSNLGLGLLCFQFLGLQRNFLCCQCILKSAGTCFYDCINAEPTGLLIDAAMELVTPWVKEISVDERREALFRASKYALTRGVTTVIDLGRYFPGTTDELSWKDFQDVYLYADSSKKMMIRTCLFFPITTWSRLLDLKLQKGSVLSEWLYLGGVKAFIDGSLGSNSALFYEEYIDTPNNYGLEVMDPEKLSNFTMAADKSGLQVSPCLLLSIACSSSYLVLFIILFCCDQGCYPCYRRQSK